MNLKINYLFNETDKMILYDFKPFYSDKSSLNEKLLNECNIIDEVNNFVNILSKNKHINLNILYHNISNIKIYYYKKRSSELASYNFISNTISINTKYGKSSIYHELLHLSSSNPKNKLSGFSNGGLNKNFNEGYTELLTERYFDKSFINKTAYEFSKLYVQCIELLVGKNIMEKLYFEANFPKLIHIIHDQKILSNQEIINIFNHLEILMTDYSYLLLPKKTFKVVKKDILSLFKAICIKYKKDNLDYNSLYGILNELANKFNICNKTTTLLFKKFFCSDEIDHLIIETNSQKKYAK